jgi:hypothetical protein
MNNIRGGSKTCSAGMRPDGSGTAPESYNIYGQDRGYGYGYGSSRKAPGRSQYSSPSQGAQDRDPPTTDRSGWSILDRFNNIFGRKK